MLPSADGEHLPTLVITGMIGIPGVVVKPQSAQIDQV